jgi:hypothetical protein
MSGIFVLDPNRKLHELREQPYEREALLQELLAEFPALLAGELVDSEVPRRWLLISREMGVADAEDGSNRWAIDHLFVDQDGIPTIVEVKRSSDTRIRREVIGQVLEYAANAVSYWPVEKLQATYDARCRGEGSDPEERLQAFLGDGAESAGFWSTVKTNLKAGKIRILLVGDSIPSEVRRIVEFLNGQMTSAEILALEIKQFGNDTLKTLVPRVYGQTEQAAGVKAPGGNRTPRQWDEATMLADADARVAEGQREFTRQLLAWPTRQGLDLKWGTGASYGSFTPVYRTKTGVALSLFSVYGSGHLEIPFVRWALPPFNEAAGRTECLARLNATGLALPATAIDKRPNVAFSQIGSRENVDRILDVFGWMLSELRRLDPA